ncbi:unnamed protein product, partial [Closterium sp. NIES-54]
MYITLYFIVTCLPDSLRAVRKRFLALDPEDLTVHLLEQHLLPTETSVVAVGAARGTPRTPFFEGCSPSPLAPSNASAAALDIHGTADVGAASSLSGKRRNSKGKGGRSGGSGSGGGGGGGNGGGGGSKDGGSGGSGGGSGGFGGGGGGSSGGGNSGGGGSGGSRGGVLPRGGSGSGHRQQSGVDIFALDYDAILAAKNALSVCAEGDSYLCVSPDPGIEAAALGASEYSLPSTARAEALHTFTLDSGANRCFFRDSTILTPLSTPVPVRLADPSGGSVLARSSTVLPCPAVPSTSLSCLHLPSFSTNLVSTTTLQDAMVTTTTPGGQCVSICTCRRTGRHLATFTRRPGSSLYTLTIEPPQVATSAQVSASGPVAPPCSCRLQSHQTLLWHHRLGHPFLPRIRGMHSRGLRLPRSLPPLPPSPAPPCLPCVEGRQRAAPHSSSCPTTSAPLQTLHMDVSGSARVSGQGRKRYFLLVVDDYTRYTTIFPVRSMGEVPDVLIPWIRAVRLPLCERFDTDLRVLRLHSERGGEFASDLLQDFCRGEGITQSFTLPASPQQNGVIECLIGLVMEVARTSMIHAAAPHFLWLFAVRYAAHQLNLWLGVSLSETSPTLRWTGEVGDVSVFRVWGSRAFVRDTYVDKLSAHAIPCVFLGFPLDDPAPSSVSLIDPVEPIEVAVDSSAAGVGGTRGAASGGAEPAGAGPRGTEPACTEPGGAESERAEPGGTGAAGPGGARTGGTGAAGAGGTAGVGARGTGAGAAGGTGAAGPGCARVGDTGAGGAGLGGAGAVGAGSGSTGRPRPFFVPLLQQVLGLPSSTGLTPPLLCPPPDQSQLPLQPASPLPAPSPYTEQTGGLIERREPVSRPASPLRVVCAGRRVPRQRPPPVLGTHHMALRPSSVPQCVPMPSPPASSLVDGPDPEFDLDRATSSNFTHLLAIVVTDTSFESAAASALVAELVDFATACRLDYAASLIAESVPNCPPSVRGEFALGTDVLEDRQEDFECFAAAVPHLTAMDAEMTSSKSTGTYVDAVPSPGANIVDGMWIFKVTWPPDSPPVFNARYVARGFSQRQGVEFFETFSPTLRIHTLRVLLHVAAQRDYELHSLDFSTGFLQGSLHKEIWLRRPPGFTGSFPA